MGLDSDGIERNSLGVALVAGWACSGEAANTVETTRVTMPGTADCSRARGRYKHQNTRQLPPSPQMELKGGEGSSTGLA
jgi:hypothetical protein